MGTIVCSFSYHFDGTVYTGFAHILEPNGDETCYSFESETQPDETTLLGMFNRGELVFVRTIQTGRVINET